MLLLQRALFALLMSFLAYSSFGQTLCSGGLQAEYYVGYFGNDQTYFNTHTPALTRIESTIDYTSDNWNLPLSTFSGSGDNQDNFSSRYKGSIYIATEGSYTFFLNSDDAGYLWIDGNALASPAVTADALIDNGGIHPLMEDSATVSLTAGWHNILIHYGENVGLNNLTFSYESASLGIAKQVVSASILCSDFTKGIAYSPAYLAPAPGAAATSVTPAIYNADGTFTSVSLANPIAGITINSTTGVISVSSSVPNGIYGIDLTLNYGSGNLTVSNAYQVFITASSPSDCGGENPAGDPAEAGLYGEYFTGYFNDVQSYFNSNTPQLVRIEANLNYTTNDWSLPTSSFGGSADDQYMYSARYRGQINISKTGPYTFYLTSDDASYLWVDADALASTPVTAQALINNANIHPVGTVSQTINLSAGYHYLLLHYGESTGDNLLTLEYESAALGIPRQVVPDSVLCTGWSFEPLPIELLSFNGQAQSNGVSLNWVTAAENDNAYFTVERSSNGRNFEAILRVATQNGNTQQRQTYSAFDNRPFSGLSYYRLRQTDNNGRSALSKTIAIYYTKEGVYFSVKPNPVTNGEMQINLEGYSSDAKWQLYNPQGKNVYQGTTAGTATTISTMGLSSGLYLLSVQVGAHFYTAKVVVE